MPRVDMGMRALDIGLALAASPDDRELIARTVFESVAEGQEVIVVIKPSIVPARVELRTIRIALGVGSLLMPEKVAVAIEGITGRRLPTLTAPAWVDGCRLGDEIVLGYDLSSGTASITGRVTPASLEDPVALLLSGAPAEASGPVPPAGLAPIAYIGSTPVVARDRRGNYVTTIIGGEARERLTYALPLISRCRGL